MKREEMLKSYFCKIEDEGQRLVAEGSCSDENVSKAMEVHYFRTIATELAALNDAISGFGLKLGFNVPVSMQ